MGRHAPARTSQSGRVASPSVSGQVPERMGGPALGAAHRQGSHRAMKTPRVPRLEAKDDRPQHGGINRQEAARCIVRALVDQENPAPSSAAERSAAEAPPRRAPSPE